MKFRLLALIIFISINAIAQNTVYFNGNGIRLRNGDVSAVGAANGNIYYDIGLNQFRFYENGAWKTLGAAPVTSVFGRTGVVTAQSGDYSSFYLPFSLTPGHIFVGNVSSVATDVAMTGDVTLSSSGVTAIGSGKVTNSMLAGSIAASKLIGSDITTVGTLGTGTYQATPIADAYISSASTWNAKVSSQWTTTGSDIYFANKVRIGSTTAPLYPLHITETSSASPRGIVGDQFNNGTNSSQIHLRKARGTEGTPLAIVSGDIVSNFSSWAHDGTSFINAGSIRLSSVGTIGTGRTPSKMEFMTMTDAVTGVLTVGATLDQQQNFGIGSAPSSRLHIQGSGTSTGEVFRITDATPTIRLSMLDNGSTTLTGALSLVGSSTNLFTGKFDGLNTTQVDGAGLWLRNTTSAASGLQQISPSIVWEGQGWKTNSTAGSQTVKIKADVLPVQGATNPTAGWQLAYSINGNAYSNIISASPQSSIWTSQIFDLQNSTSSSIFRNSAGPLIIRGGTTATTNSIQFGVTNANTTNNNVSWNFTDVVYNNVNSIVTRTNTGLLFDYSVSVSGSGVGGTVNHTINNIAPTFSMSGSTLNLTGVDVNPQITATIGSYYGILVRSNAASSGFGTATPNSTVQVAGSLSTNYVSKTGSYTLTSTDGTVEVTTGTNTQTLPTAVGCAGRWYYVTNSGSGTVTVATTSSQTFVNISGTPTSMSLTQFQTWAYQSNGANWLAFKEY
jgi:hypothetical protein